MILNIHDTTPHSVTPRHMKWIFAGLFLLMYGIFALLSFCLISIAGNIPAAIAVAVIPFVPLAYVLWDQRNLRNACVEIRESSVLVTEYPFGHKTVKQIPIADIDQAELLRPRSPKLRGPRIRDIGFPYVVFYDRQGKQLFKLLAYPEALEFQKRVTHLQ